MNRAFKIVLNAMFCGEPVFARFIFGERVINPDWGIIGSPVPGKFIFFAISPGNFSLVAPPSPPASPVLSLRGSGGVIHLAWNALPGQTYRLQYKPSLNATTWIDLLPDITATSSTASATDSTGSAPERYYRLLLLP